MACFKCRQNNHQVKNCPKKALHFEENIQAQTRNLQATEEETMNETQEIIAANPPTTLRHESIQEVPEVPEELGTEKNLKRPIIISSTSQSEINPSSTLTERPPDKPETKNKKNSKIQQSNPVKSLIPIEDHQIPLKEIIEANPSECVFSFDRLKKLYNRHERKQKYTGADIKIL